MLFADIGIGSGRLGIFNIRAGGIGRINIFDFGIRCFGRRGFFLAAADQSSDHGQCHDNT